jgi:hypothetical protein
MMDLSNTQLAILAAVLGALGVLWRVYSAINKIKTDLVGQVKAAIKAEGDGSQPMELVKQPLRVQFEKEFLTREEHRGICTRLEERTSALEARMTRVERKMESDKAEIIKAGEDRADKIHERINIVLAAVSELKGEIKHLAK